MSAPLGRERGRRLLLVRAQEVRRKCSIKKIGLELAIQSLRHDFFRMGAQKKTGALSEPSLWKISRREKFGIGGLEKEYGRAP